MTNQELGPAPGFYRHFKGDIYEVLFVARDAEASTLVVVYRDLKHDRRWTRSVSSWRELVDGRPRFVAIG